MGKQIEELLDRKNDLANCLSAVTEDKNELGENNVELKTKYEEVVNELAEMNQRNKVVTMRACYL